MPPSFCRGHFLMCVRRCPTFPPWWVVSSALAGLASGFGMGPGVSLSLFPPSLCCVVTLFWVVFGGGVWCLGPGGFSTLFVVWCGCVWVSFRPVSASSLCALPRV